MAFNYSVGDVANLLLIIGILAGWFHYVALKPIKQLLFTLKDEIKELSSEIKQNREDRKYFAEQIAKLEEKLKSAHIRIDELKQEMLILRQELDEYKK